MFLCQAVLGLAHPRIHSTQFKVGDVCEPFRPPSAPGVDVLDVIFEVLRQIHRKSTSIAGRSCLCKRFLHLNGFFYVWTARSKAFHIFRGSSCHSKACGLSLQYAKHDQGQYTRLTDNIGIPPNFESALKYRQVVSLGLSDYNATNVPRQHSWPLQLEYCSSIVPSSGEAPSDIAQ